MVCFMCLFLSLMNILYVSGYVFQYMYMKRKQASTLYFQFGLNNFSWNSTLKCPVSISAQRHTYLGYAWWPVCFLDIDTESRLNELALLNPYNIPITISKFYASNASALALQFNKVDVIYPVYECFIDVWNSKRPLLTYLFLLQNQYCVSSLHLDLWITHYAFEVIHVHSARTYNYSTYVHLW